MKSLYFASILLCSVSTMSFAMDPLDNNNNNNHVPTPISNDAIDKLNQARVELKDADPMKFELLLLLYTYSDYKKQLQESSQAIIDEIKETGNNIIENAEKDLKEGPISMSEINFLPYLDESMTWQNIYFGSYEK